MARYKYYTDGENKVVAVSSYAGKTVRGVAKCDPRDSFNEADGKMLAEARCALKVADKRYARAQKEYAKAYVAVVAAQKRLEKMSTYVTDSYQEQKMAEKNLETIMMTL